MRTLDFISYVFKISVTELTKLSAVCRPFHISPSEIKCIFVAIEFWSFGSASHQIPERSQIPKCFTPVKHQKIKNKKFNTLSNLALCLF